MAPEICHILFTYSDFIFVLHLPILKVSCVELEWLKSLNFEGPPILMPQSLSNFIFPSDLLACPETMMCPTVLLTELKNFEFVCPCLKRTHHSRYPPILSNFIFSLYLPILKIPSVQLKWLKFEFMRPCLRGIPSFWYPQILSNFIFSLFLSILKF